MDPNIIPLGKLQFSQTSFDSGLNTDAVIYIPESVLDRNTRKGLTLYLSTFWIAKDLLKFRKPLQHKIAIFSTIHHASLGKRDYNAPYIKTELIFKKTDLQKCIELLGKMYP